MTTDHISDANKPTMEWSARRLVQASRRLNELHAMLRDLAVNWNSVPTFNYEKLQDGSLQMLHPDPGAYLAELNSKAETFFEASNLASEVLHHVRSSLDFTISQATWKNQGSIRTTTQFPLCENPKEWKDNKARIKGLTAQQRRWVSEVQPLNGQAWGRHLRYLSNSDKHRSPIGLTPVAQFESPTLEMAHAAMRGSQVTLPAVDFHFGLEISGIPDSPHGDFSDALPILKEILIGAVSVVQLFLAEEGLPTMQIQQSSI